MNLGIMGMVRSSIMELVGKACSGTVLACRPLVYEETKGIPIRLPVAIDGE